MRGSDRSRIIETGAQATANIVCGRSTSLGASVHIGQRDVSIRSKQHRSSLRYLDRDEIADEGGRKRGEPRDKPPRRKKVTYAVMVLFAE